MWVVAVGVLFHGDRNDARNILLRYLSPSLQAYRLTERKEDQLSMKLGPLRALPLHTESPYGCSLCVAILLCSFVMLMISLRKLKIREN